MTQTAGLRLALCLAAAITSAALQESAADEPGPETATPTLPSPKTESPANGKKRETYPFRGVIGSIDAHAHKLTLEGKQPRRVIQVTSATRFEKQHQTATFDDLKAGTPIGGTLKKKDTGDEEAVLVRILDAKDDGAEGGEQAKKSKAKKGSE